jgi:hypothetical protein
LFQQFVKNSELVNYVVSSSQNCQKIEQEKNTNFTLPSKASLVV